MGEARNRRQNVDGRIAPLVGYGAIEHNMTVERSANGIGDGIVVTVALDQHREYSGDRSRAFLARPGALQKTRQIAEYARRITARHRRFAYG